MIAPRIETDRLVLRHHQMADFEPLYELLGSDRARFMGGPFTPKDSWFWIASEAGSWALQGIGSWAVDRRSDGSFIGQVGINQPYHFPEKEIGWIFFGAYEGNGYAKEAAEKVLTWAWAQGHETLVSYIHVENARSIALAERLGAVKDFDAVLPEGDTPDDTYVFRHRRPA